MKKRTVWYRRIRGLVLLAAVGGAATVQGANADRRDAADPDVSRRLEGIWNCHFLKANSEIEKKYYSVWTFEAAKKWVHIFWSPVHKGFVNGYYWDENQLVLGDPSNPLQQTISTHKTQMQDGGTLVIEDPRFRWKGWRCHRQPEERWPEDGLQFLDYARYPWLSGLVEDGREIEKYRKAKP